MFSLKDQKVKVSSNQPVSLVSEKVEIGESQSGVNEASEPSKLEGESSSLSTGSTCPNPLSCGVAQPVEQVSVKDTVSGSSPDITAKVGNKNIKVVDDRVDGATESISASKSEDQGANPCQPANTAVIAQTAEQGICNPQVEGATPSDGSTTSQERIDGLFAKGTSRDKDFLTELALRVALGQPKARIAREFGLHPHTIFYHLRKPGMKELITLLETEQQERLQALAELEKSWVQRRALFEMRKSVRKLAKIRDSNKDETKDKIAAIRELKDIAGVKPVGPVVAIQQNFNLPTEKYQSMDKIAQETIMRK